jgi:hypothetical protein
MMTSFPELLSQLFNESVHFTTIETYTTLQRLNSHFNSTMNNLYHEIRIVDDDGLKAVIPKHVIESVFGPIPTPLWDICAECGQEQGIAP